MDMITFLQVWAVAFAASIAYGLYKKSKERNTQKSLILTPRITYRFRRLPVDGFKVKQNKTVQTEFEPSKVFIEEKPFWKFWRAPQTLLILAENAQKALGFRSNPGKRGTPPKGSQKLEKLSHRWSPKELKQFAEKEAIMAWIKAKLFSKTEFYIIVILLILNFVLTFLVVRRIY